MPVVMGVIHHSCQNASAAHFRIDHSIDRRDSWPAPSTDPGIEWNPGVLSYIPVPIHGHPDIFVVRAGAFHFPLPMRQRDLVAETTPEQVDEAMLVPRLIRANFDFRIHHQAAKSAARRAVERERPLFAKIRDNTPHASHNP
jgi:hypothetical protein